jgi:ribonuclease J
MMGANVVYGKEENVHVSGHASNEQLQMLMRMLKPKYFVPIHGEMRHLVKHAQLVRKLGWSSEQILLATNGDVIEIDSNHAEITDRIALDTVFVDGSMVGDVKKLIKERKTMSEDGIMVVMVGLRTLGEAIECMPDIISRGFFFGEELKDIIENLKELITAAVMDQVNKSGMDYNAINSRIKKTAEKYVERNFRKNPMIITRVIEIEG